jgi:CRP/FNR family transcriptional regulator, cyclic AMP receptor protein
VDERWLLAPRQGSILAGLSRDELRWLSRRMPLLCFESGQLMYAPLDFAEVAFVLLEGRVRLYKELGGREFTLRVVRAGGTFGEAAALAGGPQGSYARALERSTVGRLGRRTLLPLPRARPEAGLRALGALGERLPRYEDTMADLTLKGVLARLASLFLRLAEDEGIAGPQGTLVPFHYSHRELGAMIGAERVAVTRALKRFRDAGAVETPGRRILVKDREVLERIAAEPSRR